MSNKAQKQLDTSIDFNDLLSDPRIAEAVEDAELREDLIDTLIALRKKAKLRQTDIAEHMECTQSTVSDFENESTDPYLSTLQRYARATGHKLHISVEDVHEASSAHYSRSSVKITQTSMVDVVFSKADVFAENYVAYESRRSDFAKAA
ncbi:helix-turn-helix domain-containing protein [Glutamicibacter halophytocola]|uniref:Helix-turn-helix domain-containing protein n=1 Tax=Glutamicibacter halophytocola TaxID=1933880 RepID=A0AA94XUK2_9MICC|nr:helix-turn-helix transcriptional regulator [Glutamicibacter halophytocola]UUX60195.1 helix-turn-helix domain-containing protein [Glutamicibacter halophytocola]